MPTVSVIIPNYNQAHYLSCAIQSILTQTYASWEVIIVDDGSTDTSATIASQFADRRVHYIYQVNQGLSATRNSGIRAAQGKFLAFLDADDEWEPNFLDRCTNCLTADAHLAGVYTLTYFMDQDGTVLPRLGGQVVAPGAFRQRILEGGLFPVHAALVRADIVRRMGLFDTQLTSLEDWDLWLRISERYAMQGVPELLARYRVYAGSMSTNAVRMHTNRIAVLTKHFGPPEGNPAVWTEEKRRAYGFAYRSSALGYIEQGQPDDGWQLLAQAASVWPELLTRLDTFYELVCGNQPKGYRGQADLLDIEGNGGDMLERLNRLFVRSGPALERIRHATYGSAYLALAMLSDQAGNWSQARTYLLQAIRHNLGLISHSVLRRLLKLCAGQKLASVARRVLGSSQVSACALLPSGQK